MAWPGSAAGPACRSPCTPAAGPAAGSPRPADQPVELPTLSPAALAAEGFERDRAAPAVPAGRRVHPDHRRGRPHAPSSSTACRPPTRPGTATDGSHDAAVIDDQALVVHVRGRGLLVLSGCGHAGIVNTVRHAMRLTGVPAVAHGHRRVPSQRRRTSSRSSAPPSPRWPRLGPGADRARPLHGLARAARAGRRAPGRLGAERSGSSYRLPPPDGTATRSGSSTTRPSAPSPSRTTRRYAPVPDRPASAASLAPREEMSSSCSDTHRCTSCVRMRLAMSAMAVRRTSAGSRSADSIR